MDYNLGEHIYSKRVINKLENKIKLANKKIDIYTYLDIKYLSSILIFVLSLCTFKVGYILGPIITIIYYNLYEYIILDKQIKKRIKKLEYEMLVFLDALILALESGKNIENSLEIVIFSLDNEISYEFKKTLFEMKFGKSLIESLESMKKRIPSESINKVSNIHPRCNPKFTYVVVSSKR